MKVQMITSSKEIKFMIDEAGFECIEAISNNLQRLGWFSPYDEGELQRINLKKFGDLSVEDVYQEEDEVVVLFCQHGRHKKTLSSMLINNEISVDILHQILIALEGVA